MYTNSKMSECKTNKSFFAGIRFTEESSDECIKLLFGTSGKTLINCQITKECFHQATATKTKGYILTHQLLYFLAGESEDEKSFKGIPILSHKLSVKLD